MRSICIIVAFIFISSISWGQDSTAVEKKGVISSLRQKLNKINSISHHQTDSTQGNILSSDTTKRYASDPLSVKQQGQHKQASRKDSITSLTPDPLAGANKSIGALQERSDSLQQTINKPIDKLNSGLSSSEKAIQQKIDEAEQGVGYEVDQLQNKVQQQVSKATDGQVKLPNKDINISGKDLDLPAPGNASTTNLTEQQLPEVDESLPKTDIPSVETESLNISDKNLKVDELRDKVKADIPGADRLTEVTGEVKNADAKLAEAEKYEAELQQVKQGDLRETEKLSGEAEQKLSSMNEVKSVKEHTQKVTQQQAEYEALIQRYRDKKLLQQEIERKAKNIANEKLNKFSPAIKEVQEELAKARKLNPAVQSFKQVTKKRPNEMNGKPVYQRLVPGITLQVYNTDVFTIDWAAQLGYKLTGRLLVGAGGLYRIGISENYSSWVKGAGIYGYRAYTDFGLLKSFYAHGEFESLHVDRYIQSQTQTEMAARSVYSGYFGLGKRYDISKKIKGSVLVLYRAEFKGDLPSMSKINLRIGFDYNTKKRKKVGAVKVI